MADRIGTPLEMNDARCNSLHVGDYVCNTEHGGITYRINHYRQLESLDGSERIGQKEWSKRATRLTLVKPWNETEEYRKQQEEEAIKRGETPKTEEEPSDADCIRRDDFPEMVKTLREAGWEVTCKRIIVEEL